jgi:hypothetical protein
MLWFLMPSFMIENFSDSNQLKDVQSKFKKLEKQSSGTVSKKEIKV